jgi:septal ring factor EnvC (AmiA/AmiB activator)
MIGRIGGLILVLTMLAEAETGHAAPASPQSPQAIEAEAMDRERDRAGAQADADAARSEIAGLDAQLAELDRAVAGGEQAVSGKRLRLAALNAEENDLKQKLGAQRAETARLLAALELFRREPPPALFVDPREVKDAVRAAILIRAITPELEARANVLKAQAEALRQTRRRADTASEDLFTTESNVAQARAQIQNLIDRKTVLEQKAEARAKQAADDVAALTARAKALRDLARGVAAAPAKPLGPEPPDPEHAGPFGRAEIFAPPVAGPPMRLFGAAEAAGSRSLGWTWNAAPNVAVMAPAEGLVEYAGPLKGWGSVVILRLGGDYHLVLAGLGQIDANPGRLVKAGEAVGRMAPAGQPAELYFEVRKNDTPVDPAVWLKGALRPTP